MTLVSDARASGQACIFSVGGEPFALSTGLLQEVVREISYVPVPLAPREVVGVFNLRGTPMILIDSGRLLGVKAERSTGANSALVLRDEDLKVALLVDRIDSVVLLADAQVMPAASEGTLFPELLELPNRDGLIGLLDEALLLQRVRGLRAQHAA